jgi:FAD/FMN-containing dehydrogenase
MTMPGTGHPPGPDGGDSRDDAPIVPAEVHSMTVEVPAVATPRDLASFVAGLRGGAVLPGDEGYEQARRVANTAVDRRPAAIVRPVDGVEVAQAVAFARDAGVPLAVRAGGHGLAGHGVGAADGALVLDLSAMTAITVDPGRRIATAEGGALAGDLVKAAFAHGLTVPLGDTATVGLGGLTLGGGVGWLARKHGLTIDHLLAVELVTADGRILRVSADEHPDLFWALRGGGGNFGVVTRFEYRAQPIGTVLGGFLVLPGTRDVLRGHVPIAASAPDELTTIAMLMAVPPMPFVPAEHHGSLAFMVGLVHDGDLDAGQAAIAPYRALAAPLGEAVMPMPYPAIYELGGPEGPMASVTRSLFLPALDDAAIDTILDFMGRRSSPMAMVQVRVLGGAVARVAADATAFAFRDRQVMVGIITPFLDPAEAPVHVAWTQAFFEALRPAGSGVYSNFLDDEGPDRVREAYPGLTYHKLAAVKARFDPTNLFRNNQNIPPAS